MKADLLLTPAATKGPEIAQDGRWSQTCNNCGKDDY